MGTGKSRRGAPEGRGGGPRGAGVAPLCVSWAQGSLDSLAAPEEAQPPRPAAQAPRCLFVCSSSRLPDKARHWTRLFL